MASILTLEIRPENLEPALGFLLSWGIEFVEERKKRNRLQLKTEWNLPKKVEADFFHALDHLIASERIILSYDIQVLTDERWKENYKKYLKRFRLIRPKNKKSFELWIDPCEYPPALLDPKTLYLEASLAFGTGKHATTQLCARLLTELLEKNKIEQVLDLGCGTGLLAMIAKKLGATRVWGVDNDPIAIKVAQDNLMRNQMSGIQFAESLNSIPKSFDLIVANILLNTLLELKPQILAALAPAGTLIFSGLLYKDVEALLKGYPELKLLERRNQQGWSALKMRRI